MSLQQAFPPGWEGVALWEERSVSPDISGCSTGTTA
jgi:hypothetical protein